MRIVFSVFCLSVANFAIAAQSGLEVLHVGMVSPTTIGVTVQAGKSQYGKQIPYVKQDGDIVDTSSHHRWLKRNGKVIGALVGEKQKILWTLDKVAGVGLNTKLADTPSTWTIVSTDDSNYNKPLHPVKIFRKSKPSDLLRIGSCSCPPSKRSTRFMQ